MEEALHARLRLMELTSGPLAPFSMTTAAEHVRHDLMRAYRPEGAMRHMHALMNAAPIVDRLNEISLPRQVLQASHDCFFPLGHGKDLAKRLNCNQTVIEGAGHDLAGTTGSVVADQLLIFLKRGSDA
jgi:pimeloyl-ACP methyl ester carboxylesterase